MKTHDEILNYANTETEAQKLMHIKVRNLMLPNVCLCLTKKLSSLEIAFINTDNAKYLV